MAMRSEAERIRIALRSLEAASTLCRAAADKRRALTRQERAQLLALVDLAQENRGPDLAPLPQEKPWR